MGKDNRKAKYSLMGKELIEVTEERNLGVILHKMI